jgi:hypothetical protein
MNALPPFMAFMAFMMIIMFMTFIYFLGKPVPFGCLRDSPVLAQFAE